MNYLTDKEIDRLQEIMNSIPDYFDELEEVVCPNCGESTGLGDDDTGMYDEYPHDFSCENCGKDYTVTGSMSWSWSTEKIYPPLNQTKDEREQSNDR